MRNFWKDYSNLLKLNVEFYRKHWLGCILVYITTFVVGVAAFLTWYYRNDLTERVKKVFHKNNDISKEIES
jgi:hypothetical protein